MRGFLKKSVQFLWGSSPQEEASAQKQQRRVPLTNLEDSDIPRYPPFAKGLPATEVSRVLATQGELIERIRYGLGISLDDFNRLLLPVLENYAAFVHLLPASEAHHHRGAGGLFRHGLEAAFAAAQASDGVIFAIDGTPRQRRDNEPRWRLASTIAGLLHDVGKPLSDMSITNKDGTLTWNPYTEFLHDWTTRNKVDRYFLRWRDRRHKRHEQFSLLTVDRIIPVATREYIAEPGPKIMEALLEAVSGTSISNPVTKLMMFADKESVQRDLKQSRLNVDEFAYGVPVERYVFDAIRRLVNTGRWTVNEKGAKVWYLHQGVFIAWRNLGDLYAIIDQDKIPGIPRDPDTLADILIERGFAIQNKVTEEGGEATYRYWEVAPDGLGASMLMLRFDSHELVFTSEPPAPAAGTVNGQHDSGGIDSLKRRSQQDQGVQDEDSQSTDLQEQTFAPTDESAGEAGEAFDQDEESSGETAGVDAAEASRIQQQANDLMGGIGMADLSMFQVPHEQTSGETPAASSMTEEAQLDADEAENPEEDGEAVASEKEEPGESEPEPVSEISPQPVAPSPAPARSGNVLGFGSPAAGGSTGSSSVAVNVLGFGQSAQKAASVVKAATTCHATDSVFALNNLLDRYGPASDALKALLLPSIGSQGRKGVVKQVDDKLIVPYPEGLRVAGKTSTVMNHLADHGAIEVDMTSSSTSKKGRTQTVGQTRCIVLNKQITEAYLEAMERAKKGNLTGSSMPGTTVSAGGAGGEKKSSSLFGTPRSGANPKLNLKPKLGRRKPKGEQKQESQLQAGQEQKTVATKQNTTTARPPAPKPKPKQPVVHRASNKAPAPRAEVPELSLGNKDFTAVTEPKTDLYDKPPVDAKLAIEQLTTMMRKGEGRWLIGAVERTEDSIMVGVESLTLIQQEHGHLSKINMRSELRNNRCRIRSGKIIIPNTVGAEQ